jgi:hypothetical protein
MMSINAVKAVEIGAGFDAVELGGENNADQIRKGKKFMSNNAGGILGGISTGRILSCASAFKPTSSILTPVKTIDTKGKETEIITKGRHDPCVGIARYACCRSDDGLRSGRSLAASQSAEFVGCHEAKLETPQTAFRQYAAAKREAKAHPVDHPAADLARHQTDGDCFGSYHAGQYCDRFAYYSALCTFGAICADLAREGGAFSRSRE